MPFSAGTILLIVAVKELNGKENSDYQVFLFPKGATVLRYCISNQKFSFQQLDLPVYFEWFLVSFCF